MGPCECGAEVKYDDGSCSNSASEHWKAIATEQRARADAAEAEVVRKPFEMMHAALTMPTVPAAIAPAQKSCALCVKECTGACGE